MEGVALSKNQVMQVVIALRNDNPQLFWVLNDLRYGVRRRQHGNTAMLLFFWYAGAEGL